MYQWWPTGLSKAWWCGHVPVVPDWFIKGLVVCKTVDGCTQRAPKTPIGVFRKRWLSPGSYEGFCLVTDMAITVMNGDASIIHVHVHYIVSLYDKPEIILNMWFLLPILGFLLPILGFLLPFLGCLLPILGFLLPILGFLLPYSRVFVAVSRVFVTYSRVFVAVSRVFVTYSRVFVTYSRVFVTYSRVVVRSALVSCLRGQMLKWRWKTLVM